MKIKQIAKVVDNIAPLGLALDWDNVGLLVGDGERDVKNILLTIDVTADVIAEAKKGKVDLVISYHPVIWDGLKTVTAGSVVYELIRANIAVFSVHTALDIADGGVNDGLAAIVGIENGKAIGDYVAGPGADNYKMVVFVPRKELAKVSNAIFKAGAGWIGNYSHCGFGGEGVGTFKPLAGSKPAIGKKDKLEKVDEVRFETIVPADKLRGCIKAMIEAHPYEEPAYDCFKLHNDHHKFGLGRMGQLGKARQMRDIIKDIKKATGAKAIGVIGKENRVVKKAAVCAGSCGKIINQVIAAGCDLYLTGELKHHLALAAAEAGLTCICLSHTVSERFILKKLAKSLQKDIKGVTIKVSKKDSDPFSWRSI